MKVIIKYFFTHVIFCAFLLNAFGQFIPLGQFGPLDQMSSALYAGKNSAVSLGKRAFARGQYNAAMEYFKTAIDAGTSSGEAYFYAGSILELRRKYSAALMHYGLAYRNRLSRKFKKAVLWKLVLLHKAKRNYSEMLLYIGELEARGVSHPNFETFREEANKFLSPEKIEARKMIEAAKDEINTWKKNNPGKEFWTQDNDSAYRALDRYNRALQIDPLLYHYYWQIAQYSEKMHDWKNALNAYLKISRTEKSKKVLYKIGVMHKRLENYKKAVKYFNEAVKAEGSNKQLSYYLFLNLSQVQYALGNHTRGWSNAQKALRKEGKANRLKFSFASYMGCLHGLLGDIVDKNSGDKKKSKGKLLKKYCVSVGARTKKVKEYDKRVIFYAKALYVRKYVEISNKSDDRKKGNKVNSYYLTALFPAQYVKVNLGLAREWRKEEAAGSIKSWRALPVWLNPSFLDVFDYWIRRKEWKYAYLLVNFYPEVFSRYSDNPKFQRSLMYAQAFLTRYDEAYTTAQNLRKSFDVTSIKVYLQVLAKLKKWNGFQEISLEYAHSLNSSAKQVESMKSFVRKKMYLQQIPLGDRSHEFIKFMREKKIEPIDSPQPESKDNTVNESKYSKEIK